MRGVVITGCLVAACSFEGASVPDPEIDAAPGAIDAAADAQEMLGPWGNIRRLTELESIVGVDADYDDPMLTDDLVLYFAGPNPTSTRQDIYTAVFDPGTRTFEPPVRVDSISTDDLESTLWISPNGLHIIFSRAPSGGDLDMYEATRGATAEPFTNIELLGESSSNILHTSGNEGVGSLADNGLTLYFASDRDGQFDLFRATRPDLGNDFDTVDKLAISSNNRQDISPKLSADQSLLYFTSSPIGTPGRLHVASFDSATGEYVNPMSIDELNTQVSDNDDLFVDSSGRRALFASDRENLGGSVRLYMAER